MGCKDSTPPSFALQSEGGAIIVVYIFGVGVGEELLF